MAWGDARGGVIPSFLEARVSRVTRAVLSELFLILAGMGG